MSFRGEWRRLRELDWRELDLKESGGWPWSLQLICCGLVFGLTLAAMHWYLARPQVEALNEAQAEERTLLRDYRLKAARASRLPTMLEEMAVLEARMEALMAMLPTGAEIPSLLDSISEIALDHRLSIDAIRLRSPETRDFYIERPFDIQVEGDYHRLAAFLADIAALPRIVTQHDFSLEPAEEDDTLTLSMLARTYSYRTPAEAEGEGAP